MVRGYILIEARTGRARQVFEEASSLNLPDFEIESVDVVTGPYDVMAVVQADTIDQLGRGVTEGIQGIEGVHKTTTCLVTKTG